MTNSIITLPNNVVSISNNQIKTSSLKVAEHFGKRHDNILRTIKSLDCSPEFRLLNFEETTYMRENPKGGLGISSESYEMTKDGFMFLVMGFTGKKAAAIKEAYINAFNEMEKQMRGEYSCINPEQKATLLEIVSRKVNGNNSLRAQVWARHNNHFKVNSYALLPASRFYESVSYLETMEIKGAESLANNTREETVKLAYSTAAEIARHTQQSVFDAMLANVGDDWQHERWLFYFKHEDGACIPHAQIIDKDANIASLDRLAKMIGEPCGIHPSNESLANLAAACNAKLLQRLEYQAEKKRLAVV